MGSTWFVGDLHFGHHKVSEIRGFSTTQDHDLAITNAWHKQVKTEDHVYVMGDLSSGSRDAEWRALSILGTLPGYKTLIAGNHDSISSIHRKRSPHLDAFYTTFDQVSDFGRIRVEGRNILLSHYPYWSQGDGPGRGKNGHRYEQYRLPDLGEHLIHAHTHHTDPFSGSWTNREMCVSWDAWSRLVNLGDVAKWLKSKGEKNG